MELRVDEVQLPQEIRFNYSELKKELEEKVSIYSTMVYSDDQIKSAKTDRADLNRLKKALNDERIRREKEYMQPFNVFKAQINEIIGIIDKPVALIDKQIKAYEERQRQEKKQKIEEFFESVSTAIQEFPAWLKLPMFWDEKWLNTSVSMKSIQETIATRVNTIISDLSTLSDLPEFAFEATETYKATLDLNKSIAEGRRLSEMQKRKAEQEQIKTEQEKVRAEQERIRKEQERAWMEEQARLSAMVTPEEVAESTEAYQEAANVGGVRMSEELSKQWISFKALLSVEDAKQLKEFFESRNIEFSRI